jgi:hypothetical protein
MTEESEFGSLQKQEILSSYAMSRTALGPSVYQPLLPRELSDKFVKLTTHLYVMPRSIQFVLVMWYSVKHRNNFTFIIQNPVNVVFPQLKAEHFMSSRS